MDISYAIGFIQESLYLLIVFSILLIIGMWKGRYSLITIILSLYLALLFTVEFPYLETLLPDGGAIGTIGLFLLFTVVGIFLFRRHIPGDDYERAFEGFWKKILLAVVATGLIMAFSYHVLPITEFIHPGTPIQHLFAPDTYFFWWLLAPLIILFFV